MTDRQGSFPWTRVLAVGLATLAVTTVFLGMIWDFLIALFLAVVFSAMAQPIYRKILVLCRGLKGLASAVTLILLYVCVLAPVLGLLVLAAAQAHDLAGTIVSAGQNIDLGGLLLNPPDWLPFRETIEQAAPTITRKVGEMAGNLAGFFVSSLSAVTRGTASFFINLFIMTYAMVFFLQAPDDTFLRLLRFSGLSPAVRSRLGERILSISRATIKGTLVIGVLQGFLGGLGFLMTGISGSAFWGTVIAVLSVIPGVGPGLVLVPGVLYLFAVNEVGYAIGLALWTLLVVTTIDNLLRPTLVGRDTKMPDLLILVSTLGGLSVFGATGLLIGPVIAGLLLTIWQIFGETVSEAVDGNADQTVE